MPFGERPYYIILVDAIYIYIYIVISTNESLA